MLATDRERLREHIEALTREYGRDRTALIPILQEVQKSHHEICDFAMQTIADLLGLHPVEVYSVVSFYAFLHDEPKGEFVIRLCRTICCDLAGNDALAQQLENDLGVSFGETTSDGKFTLEWANCIGMCDQGPALLVNDRVYTRVTPDSVHDILEGCRQTFGLHATHAKEEHLV